MNDSLFTNLNDFKSCIKTLTEIDGLLNRRNFKLHNIYDNIDIESINLQNSYYMIAQNIDNKTKFIFIYFINTTGFLSKTYKSKNINLLDCKKYIKELYNININNIIVDIIIIFTKSIKINNLIEKKIIEKININNIQIFSYKNLLFNVSKHKYIPKYIKIISDKKEIDLICKTKNIDNVQKLPKINIMDPLSNFYGIKIGELFEIRRNNHNSGEYIYYRLCIN